MKVSNFKTAKQLKCHHQLIFHYSWNLKYQKQTKTVKIQTNNRQNAIFKSNQLNFGKFRSVNRPRKGSMTKFFSKAHQTSQNQTYLPKIKNNGDLDQIKTLHIIRRRTTQSASLRAAAPIQPRNMKIWKQFEIKVDNTRLPERKQLSDLSDIIGQFEVPGSQISKLSSIHESLEGQNTKEQIAMNERRLLNINKSSRALAQLVLQG